MALNWHLPLSSVAHALAHTKSCAPGWQPWQGAGCRLHGVGGSHPHHPFPSQPLGAGAGPWTGLPPPCPLQPQSFGRGLPHSSLQALPASRLCRVAGSIQGCHGLDPAALQPHGAREADGFVLPAQMHRLSLPSLALTHFFLSLLSQPARRTLISSPESPFPKACSAASFANPFPGACA